VINIGRADLDHMTPDQLRKNYVLCGSHFEDSQFANVLHKTLVWNAVPTLFDVSHVVLLNKSASVLLMYLHSTFSFSHALCFLQ